MKRVCVKVYATDEELANWSKWADRAKMSVSQWIRFNLPGQEPQARVGGYSDRYIIESPSLAGIAGGRKACKHGLLFCKKCK